MKQVSLVVLFSILFFNEASSFGATTEISGQVKGAPSNGSLNSATSLAQDGVGFVELFFQRDRHYASQGLVAIIESTAREISLRYPDGERFQLGDLSTEDGGFISGHASHQNGLDYDAVYFRVNHQEQDPDHVKGFQEQFVVKGEVTNNFDLERNWVLMKLLKETGRLNRVFVAPEIKKALCKYALRMEQDREAAGEVLRHLRPYKNHRDHMHVRITCPAESPECVEQVPVDPGSGCE